MKLPPVQSLVFLILTIPAAAQDLLWSGSGSGSGSGTILEISLVRSSGLANANDPKVGTPVDYDYFLLGTNPSPGFTNSESESKYTENIYVAQNAGYGSMYSLSGSAGNHAFATGGVSLFGKQSHLRIVNGLVIDTTSLLDSAFTTKPELLGLPPQLMGDSIIYYDDSEFSRISSTNYYHTLLILNDPSGTAFDSADFGSAKFDLSKFATAKLYREDLSKVNVQGGSSYYISFVADLKSIPEPGTLVLLIMGVLPLARRRRRD